MTSVLSASARGATFLILLQVGSRALTFVVNQILLRFLSPELLGISAQLELYSISVLYFARESLRVALQRRANGVQDVVNISYLAILLGTPLAYALGTLYSSTALSATPHFIETLVVYGVATVIELFTEPSFVAVQYLLLYKVRASAETVATIGKCLATCGSAVWATKTGHGVGPLPFAIGQLSYATLLLLVYIFRLWPVAKQQKFSLWPVKLTSKYVCIFYAPLCSLGLSLFIQSGLKYVLTQGDALLITGFASLQDQGAYALASNYGGLIARMLFQPIEESSRNLFAKLCAPQPETQQPSPEGLNQAKGVLQDILKLYNIISIVACALGPTMAPLLLSVVAGSKWANTGAGTVLATYCYYIPLLALNGVTEAFVAAVADNKALRVQSVMMGVFFAGFAMASYIFLVRYKLGAEGLVYANCVNMAMRILFNGSFIWNFFEHFDAISTLPSALSICAAVTVPAILKVTEGTLSSYGLLGELARTGAVAATFALSLEDYSRKGRIFYKSTDA